MLPSRNNAVRRKGPCKMTLKRRDPAALRPQPMRDGADFWPTPRCLSDALVHHVLPSLPPGPVWECAAGDGRLVAAMRAAGRTVFASDLMPVAAGIQRHDFLLEAPPDSAHGAVIATNPPYNQLDEFVRHGLALLDRGVATALVLLLRCDALTAGGRAAVLNRASAQWTCCWRPVWVPGTKGGGRWSNVWIVWHAGGAGPAAAHYLNAHNPRSIAHRRSSRSRPVRATPSKSKFRYLRN
jgi:hypothetical protein